MAFSLSHSVGEESLRTQSALLVLAFDKIEERLKKLHPRDAEYRYWREILQKIMPELQMPDDVQAELLRKHKPAQK